MIEKKKILAVILARGGSKGIPKKNIVPVNYHPLISYSIMAAKNSKYIDKVVVSSDSKEIINKSLDYGIHGIVKRPKFLASDIATSADALHHAVTEAEKIFDKKFDYIIELPCVSPLRDHYDVNNVIEKLHKSNLDSVISYVDTGEKHPIRLKRIKNNKISNFCKEYPEASWGSRRQDFEPSYIRNGAIYCMTRNCILKQKSRWGKKSFPYLMPDHKSVNIDTKYDLLVAKLLIKNGFCANRPKKISKIIKFKKKSKYKIIVTTKLSFLSEFTKKILKNYNCIFAEDVKVHQLQELLKDVDGWVCSPSPEYKIDKGLLKNAKNLKAIFTPSTGSNHLDKKYLEIRNIKYFTIRDHSQINNIKASSEFTFGLIISSMRSLIQGNEIVKSGNWRNYEDFVRGNQLYNKKIGIIGFGRIGSNIYKYAKAFSMKVKAFDPYKSSKLKKFNIYSNLSNLLKSSDIVVVCVHLTNQTKFMCNETFFSKMKKNSIFINTSRGEILNENSLIKYLKNKKIKAAAVDVIQGEQKNDITKNKLYIYSKKNENLVITPHMAGLTYESETIAAEIILNRLNIFFKFYKDKKKI